MRIYLIGYMGCGKTSIGKVVAKELGLSFVDMDLHIENKYFKSVAQIFSEVGETKFREIEHKSLLEVSQFENSIISTGGGAPCFFDNIDVMNQSGTTIYIQLTAKELSDRLKTTKLYKRPILANVKNDDLEEFIAKNLKIREPFYQQAKYKVRGTDEEIVQHILEIANAISL